MGDGNIGLMSNGAGMCMAIADQITSLGGNPSNFLDLGGATYHERISHAFELMQSDAKIKVVYFHIFCGHSSADKIALVIKDLYKKSYLKKPLVMTVKGRGHEEAIKIFEEIAVEFPVFLINDLDKACVLTKEIADTEEVKYNEREAAKPQRLKKVYNKNRISSFSDF